MKLWLDDNPIDSKPTPGGRIDPYIKVRAGVLAGQVFTPHKWSKDRQFAFVHKDGVEHRIHNKHFETIDGVYVYWIPSEKGKREFVWRGASGLEVSAHVTFAPWSAPAFLGGLHEEWQARRDYIKNVFETDDAIYMGSAVEFVREVIPNEQRVVTPLMQNPCKEVNVEMNDKGGQIAENCKTMMSATPSVQKHRDDLAAHAERAMNDLRLNTESVMYAEKLRLIARTRREQQARMDLVARECEALGATVAECGPPANRIRQFIFYVLCVVLAALSYVAVGVWALYLWGN